MARSLYAAVESYNSSFRLTGVTRTPATFRLKAAGYEPARAHEEGGKATLRSGRVAATTPAIIVVSHGRDRRRKDDPGNVDAPFNFCNLRPIRRPSIRHFLEGTFPA